MNHRSSRRVFIQRAGAGALLALGDLSFLSKLRPLSAEETRLAPEKVRLRPEIEPLVELIEETPRSRLLEEMAGRIHRGTSYQEVLAALLLAGVRNIQPRPQVGFKFHAVLVVNSAHIASLASPDSERWLPIFWALDYFKSAQAQDVREGDWTMAPVEESAVPPAHRAREDFREAMERWDVPAADAAAAGVARACGAAEVFELFWRLGARDFRSIGHKAIFAANAWRTLQAIGWQHAEPVVRSLAYALLMHEGDNPAKRDAPADRPGRRNLELARSIRPEWRGGKPDSAATADLLSTLREASEEDAARKAVELLNRGVAPQSLWDALLAGAAELLVRQPGIVALHAVTTSNALRFAYDAAADDETRRLLLLQNASFLPLFREAMRSRGNVRDFRLDALEPAPLPGKEPPPLEEIFATAGSDRMAAARKALAYLQERRDARELIDAGRLLVFLKGNDSHDYKFSSAVLEDYLHLSPTWRERYLAASFFHLRASTEPDNQLVKRTKEALRVESV
jgi:hypothetical protein